MTAETTTLPDHPIRKHVLYQLFHRLPRGLLNWVTLAGGAWALGLSDVLSNPMADTTRVIVLIFVASLYGIDKFMQAFKGVT